MRELTSDEIGKISGGFEGTKIPFMNRFISGTNWPGGGAGAISGMVLAWGIGTKIGAAINYFNQDHFGMSTGKAIYLTVNAKTVST